MKKEMIPRFILHGLVSLLFSLVLFSTVMPRVEVLMGIVLISEIMVYILYDHPSNNSFYWQVIMVYAGIFVGYFIQWVAIGRSCPLNDRQLFGPITWVCLLLIIIVPCMFWFKPFQSIRSRNKPDNCCTNDIGGTRTEETSKVLFRERSFDLERLLHFLRCDTPIIGVDSQWGEGKTFLVDELCNRVMDDYEVIRVQALSGHLEELEVTLIDELDRILRRNKIYSRSSKQMLRFFESNSIIKQISQLLYHDDRSITETFAELKNDINKVSKNVLIIVDDIERVGDQKEIKKMLALMESLSSPSIFIICLYNGQVLYELLNRDYIEKYIPVAISLTPLEFGSIVRYLWDELEMNDTNLDKQSVENMTIAPLLSSSIIHLLGLDAYNQADSFRFRAHSFRLSNVSVRRVRATPHRKTVVHMSAEYGIVNV